MKRGLAVVTVIALSIPVITILWYISSGHFTSTIAAVAILISLSIGYLFYEALSYRPIRGETLRISLRRRLDIKEFSRIFGAIALLPVASVIISNYTLRGAVKPIRLYLIFVLIFLVGWAFGTVETSKIIQAEDTAKEYSDEGST